MITFFTVKKLFMKVGSKGNMVRIINYCYSLGINYDELKNGFLEMEINNFRNIWDRKSRGYFYLVPVMGS